MLEQVGSQPSSEPGCQTGQIEPVGSSALGEVAESAPLHAWVRVGSSSPLVNHLLVVSNIFVHYILIILFLLPQILPQFLPHTTHPNSCSQKTKTKQNKNPKMKQQHKTNKKNPKQKPVSFELTLLPTGSFSEPWVRKGACMMLGIVVLTKWVWSSHWPFLDPKG